MFGNSYHHFAKCTTVVSGIKVLFAELKQVHLLKCVTVVYIYVLAKTLPTMLPEDFSVDRGILSLQDKLGLPTDFFKRLLQEDDWSFIIKLHALVEAACTDLLLHHFDEPSLKNIISRLELSNKSFGKLAFIKELELLGDASRRYISSLSEWRNNFVHNVQNCNASLDKIIGAMDKNEVKKFAVDFSPLEATLQKISKGPLDLLDAPTRKQIDTNNIIERAKRNPKFHIWVGGYNLLTSLVDMYDYSDYRKYDKAMTWTGIYDEDDENNPDEELNDQENK